MIHVAPLNEDNLAEVEAITESETYLAEHGYQVDTGGFWSVVNHKTDDDDSGHIIKAGETTAVPFDDADVVADSIEIYLCSCGAYRYQQGVADLDERDTLEWESCKHIDKVPEYKAKRAESDDQQETL